MKVICAGLPKTGTKSMAKALEILGYNNCDSLPQLHDSLDEWYDLMFHGKLPDFKAMFKGYDSTTDVPTSFFYKEVFRTFPNAKVILMIREENGWAKSWRKQMSEILEGEKTFSRFLLKMSPTYRKYMFDVLYGMLYACLGSIAPDANQVYRRFFQMHSLEVKASVPKDQLLVFDVTQGWKPLCDFLGCAVPKVPFPHENKAAAVTSSDAWEINGKDAMERKILREVWLRVAIIVCVAAILLFYVLRFCC